MEGVFHIFSNGAKTPDLFTCNDDFVRAVNLIAVLSYLFGVKILAFCLEDTHLHILARADIDSVTKFKRELQRIVRRWRGPGFDLDMEMASDADYQRKVGTYVICQATKDGKHILPTDYRWSSASLYFRRSQGDVLWKYCEDGSAKDVVHMSDISLRRQREMFHTRFRLPDMWEVCDGLILPSSFVDVGAFEAIYRTHNCFRIFYGSGKSSDEAVMASMSDVTGVNMLEAEARMAASQTCMKLFGFYDVRKLDIDKRIRLGKELRARFRMGLPQIARRVHLPESEIRKVIK